jgi:hypothetical protein
MRPPRHRRSRHHLGTTEITVSASTGKETGWRPASSPWRGRAAGSATSNCIPSCAAYTDWQTESAVCSGAAGPAFVLNHRGGRLSVRGASVFTAIVVRAGLDDEASAHVLHHTFATTLVRGGADLVVAARAVHPHRPPTRLRAPADRPLTRRAGRAAAPANSVTTWRTNVVMSYAMKSAMNVSMKFVATVITSAMTTDV